MRLLLVLVLGFSFAAYGQRVKENIKQSTTQTTDSKPVKKQVRK
ncbi:hypothetical protein [Peredibacter starrii]|uniref:Uncharacterized protein n=1 Tax=Peredibacter starrii TaxID=28202 RepID=A0AAX4HV43_9BACT|nr:hypothetical protein [Peredibacter starrii]WPU67121.1 hypothetical protein SOO65_10180 [Peredibacter starrii]